MRLKADGATGAIAIYDETIAGDAPFTTPLSHLPAVYFHSALNYPAIINTVTGSITLAAKGAHSNNIDSHILFAHGRSGYPAILGRITNIASVPVEFNGSLPVQMDDWGFGRWCTIGADSTNVVLHEQWCTFEFSGIGSIALNYEIDILDWILQ